MTNRIFTALAIAVEICIAAWHIYMERKIYKPLWEPGMKQKNPRAWSLLYISLAHLIGGVWHIGILLMSTIPTWLLVARLFGIVPMTLAINNYLKQYTSKNLGDKVKEWIREKVI